VSDVCLEVLASNRWLHKSGAKLELHPKETSLPQESFDAHGLLDPHSLACTRPTEDTARRGRPSPATAEWFDYISANGPW